MDGEGSSAGVPWTVGSLWHDIAGRRLGDELLEWAPDLFAFTDVVLDRSEAYRFAVSPPPGASWPPSEMPTQAHQPALASAIARYQSGRLALPGTPTGRKAVGL